MDVVIVGAGMSGLCMGIRLKRAGIPFVIVEKSPRLGGTWWDNTYPGCACDIPSHLYAFSFAPKHDWSQVYPPQPEILAYLETLASEHGLLEHIRLGVTVRDARYQEATGRWRVALSEGDVLDAGTLVSAVGALHVPKYPAIAGRGEFAGPSWHSARWDHSVDLKGKRVGVIGNAASAVQLVPHVAEQAQELYVFQRSPNWVLPRFESSYPRWAQFLFRSRVLQRLYRWGLYFYLEYMFLLVFRKGAWAGRFFRWLMTRGIHSKIQDEATRAVLVPDYPPGCKRALLSNDYYPTLNRENVSLVTSPLTTEDAAGLVTEEKRYDLDAVVYATGFDPMAVGPLQIYGREGQVLNERWATSPRAHLGITVPGFPNFYVLLGPNTGLGHNSVMWMVECQVNYVFRCMQTRQRKQLKALEVKEEALARFYETLERRMSNKVWSECTSWYRRDDGLNFTLWPSSTGRYWWETRRPRLRDFHCKT
ncbi:NAD(P)/FAD-dependent oxidoreductase [Planctomycetota bacterium]|nr:NAD(P)/FAD-dependent oxidoreductase [Planctomycetota bacterium]